MAAARFVAVASTGAEGRGATSQEFDDILDDGITNVAHVKGKVFFLLMAV